VFLLLQGTSTLAFRLIPELDRAFPALLQVTRMIPSHSLLHITIGLVALAVLVRGSAQTAFRFAFGFGAFYLLLAIMGVGTGHPLGLGLQPFDHPIHFIIGLLGLLAAGLTYRARPAGEVSS
jgi:hypothetical protein